MRRVTTEEGMQQIGQTELRKRSIYAQWGVWNAPAYITAVHCAAAIQYSLPH